MSVQMHNDKFRYMKHLETLVLRKVVLPTNLTAKYIARAPHVDILMHKHQDTYIYNNKNTNNNKTLFSGHSP